MADLSAFNNPPLPTKSISIAFITVLFLSLVDLAPPSYLTYNLIVLTWIGYTQTLYHIILNRTSVMWSDRSKVPAIAGWLHVAIGVVNLCIAPFWAAAELGTWEFAERWNFYTDKSEKFFFMGVDVWLNYWYVTALRQYSLEGHFDPTTFKVVMVISEVLALLGLGCDVLVAALMWQEDT
ncbi:hypothetical protein HK405_006567 [Cladochytrium tenue]|nr:hypothetical protein HK405_006567 [Cladochytrium tenue]